MSTSTIAGNLTSETSTLYFQDIKNTVFKETEKNFQELHSQWEKEYKNLEQFEIDVRDRGGKLQHEKVCRPDLNTLENEKQSYLKKYWGFKGTSDKINLYSLELSKTIVFLTPQPRVYYEEERLKKDQPLLLDQIKNHEETCKPYVVKLQEYFKNTNVLKDKFINCMSNNTNNLDWSLQRFCQIVDQEGKPLSMAIRFYDRVTNPIIAKPKGDLSSSSEVNNNTSSLDANTVNNKNLNSGEFVLCSHSQTNKSESQQMDQNVDSIKTNSSNSEKTVPTTENKSEGNTANTTPSEPSATINSTTSLETKADK